MEIALEGALRAVRLYTTGNGSEATVYRSAVLVTTSVALETIAPDKEDLLADASQLQESSIQEAVLDDDQSDFTIEGLAVEASVGLTKVESTDKDIYPHTEVTELFTWGKSANYQLGYICTQPEQPVPRSVSKLSSIKFLSCGRFHTLAVATCGSVYAWGFGGTSSRLGIEGTEGSPPFVVEPVRLPEFGPSRQCASKVAAGLNHSMALTVHGKIFAWGSNSHGQLGVQGVPSGPDARARRPVVVKSALKGEAVGDIAAGVEHSICSTAKGNVFAWGSNAYGGVGLGVPLGGPSELSQPQQLPHLRGTYAVVAASTGHVSVALVAHGDAMIFGTPASQIDGSSRTGALTDAYYLPNRVRRRGQKDSLEEEDWQKQRGGSLCLPPLQSVTIRSEDAFGVDSDGHLWTWTLRQRPCLAESIYVTPITSGTGSHNCNISPKSTFENLNKPVCPEQGWSAVSSSAESVWTVDRSPAACLWCLRPAHDQRAGEPTTQWFAERSEHVGQVSHITCSPEHAAALVKYKRPIPPSESSHAVVDTKSNIDDSGGDDSDEEKPLQCSQTYNPLPLQQLCENRLLQQLSPQSFTMVCEIAWEFRRPELLDCAYMFLRANAPIMFSRLNLPAIARLPFEVIAAFEMTANGAIASPSLALEMEPWNFPPPEWLQDTGGDSTQQITSLLPEPDVDAGSSNPTSKVRKRRRGGRGGDNTGGAGNSSASSASKTSPLHTTNLPPGASPSMSPSSLAHPSTGLSSPMQIASQKSPNLIGKHSPTLAAIDEKASPHLVPQVGADASGSPKSRMPKPALKKRNTGVQMSDLLRPKAPTIAYGANTAYADVDSFDRGHAKISEGPSSALVAAVASASSMTHTAQAETSEAHQKPTGWMRTETQGESSVSLRDVLTKVPKSQRRSAADNDPTGEKKRCSWGYDATCENPSPKGVSIAEAQELEIKRKEDEEIKEIEAMFAAMEASEIEAQFAALEAKQRKEDVPKKSSVTVSHPNRHQGKDRKKHDSKGIGGEDLMADSRSSKTYTDAQKCDWNKNKAWREQEWSEWWSSSSWWEGTSSNVEGNFGRGRGQRGKGRGKNCSNKDAVSASTEQSTEANAQKAWRRRNDDGKNTNSMG